MRVLSVRQPWAWAIIHADKRAENRTWMTHYRGPLAIHASRTPDLDAWRALDHLEVAHPLVDELYYGSIIGVVDLVDCVLDSSDPWSVPGVWHWLLSAPRALSDPIEWRGQVGLPIAPAHVAEAISERAGEAAHI